MSKYEIIEMLEYIKCLVKNTLRDDDLELRIFEIVGEINNFIYELED